MSWYAILVYVLALAIPVFLLVRFHSLTWYWHLLAIAAGLSIGFIPTPTQFKTTEFDLLFGGAFIALIVWGIGGLIIYTPHHTKHA